METLKIMYLRLAKATLITALLFTFACDAKTGDSAGEENRENPTLDKATGEGSPTSREDNADENPNGTITADSLNTDSSSIKVDNNQ
ncbi:hypothetical protein GXP67_25215 [Rhodocytophaga rosea]|uniref:Uncharacterized protein n=1 Tax=Rhodocytophaga rosea TaxID=2704465 RepID=A0A6C0GQC3_9BACT|nr:hypothetical protein [Rhodocytophaga rosea]QHT69710.1 hypothetical protein GXP67_25215 [Rhodocytophaga rosea]